MFTNLKFHQCFHFHFWYPISPSCLPHDHSELSSAVQENVALALSTYCPFFKRKLGDWRALLLTWMSHREFQQLIWSYLEWLITKYKWSQCKFYYYFLLLLSGTGQALVSRSWRPSPQGPLMLSLCLWCHILLQPVSLTPVYTAQSRDDSTCIL